MGSIYGQTYGTGAGLGVSDFRGWGCMWGLRVISNLVSKMHEFRCAEEDSMSPSGRGYVKLTSWHKVWVSSSRSLRLKADIARAGGFGLCFVLCVSLLELSQNMRCGGPPVQTDRAHCQSPCKSCWGEEFRVRGPGICVMLLQVSGYS